MLNRAYSVFLKEYRILTAKNPYSRSHINFYSDNIAKIEEEVSDRKWYVEKLPVIQESPLTIFANTSVDLDDIEVYGFDYDYTLVRYKKAMLEDLYDSALGLLVTKMGYPKGIREMHMDFRFANRGLHYDIIEGILMKIDGSHRIQFDTAYIGHRPVSNEKLIQIYGSSHVPISFMNDVYGNALRYKRMIHYIDNFSLVEVALLSDIAEYFLAHSIPYDPIIFYTDVHNAITEIHIKQEVHKKIQEDVATYIDGSTKLTELLTRLRSAGKKTFLVTNSKFSFVDAGIRYMTNKSDWIKLFDVVVTESGKPGFYTAHNRPFRRLDENNKSMQWTTVTNFETGKVYSQGNVTELMRITGWTGSSVLYFGDHMYSDFVDPVLKIGWRSGAIIPELEREINITNKKSYQKQLAWLLQLESLISKYTPIHPNDLNKDETLIIESWKQDRLNLIHELKEVFNHRFGSTFRTNTGASYFTRRLARFADIYTSRIDNLLNYSLSQTFFNKRVSLPHEPAVMEHLGRDFVKQ